MKKYLSGIIILILFAFLFGKFWIWCMNQIKNENQNYKEYKQAEYDNIIISPYDSNAKHLPFYKKKLKTLCVKPNLKTKYFKEELSVKNGKLDLQEVCDYPYEPVFATDLRVIIDEPKTVFNYNSSNNDYGIGKVILLEKIPNSFTLKYDCAPEMQECSYTLQYKRGKDVQELKTQSFKNNYELDLLKVAKINWAGDINNDGLLDFLITYNLSDNKSRLELYTTPNKYESEEGVELVQLKRFMDIDGH